MTEETAESFIPQHMIAFIIDNKVEDITEWIPKHPGGNIIMKGVGKDATELFNNIGHSTFAKSMFKKYVIGVVKKV